jgi:hypothetical protein
MRKPVAACLVATLGALAACSSESSSSSSDRPDLTVSISGEGSSAPVFAFPPASEDEPAFVDGWEVKFDRILTTVEAISLSDNPDTSPTDQSQTGPVLTEAKGPWAVDLNKPGAPSDIHPATRALEQGAAAAEAEGKNPAAQRLARFTSVQGDRPLDPSTRYAFGFEVITAAASAKKTNVDPATDPDYAEMVQKGIAMLYVGTATFKGTDCKSSDPSYDFSTLPKTVKFRFGFKTPTKYINCQNTDLKGKAFDGEEAQRGIQVTRLGTTLAQMTFHLDHPFWNTVDHDAAEMYFDQMAAVANADGVVVLDDLAKLDLTSFKDKNGKELPWRSCIASKPPKSGTRAFDTGSVTVDPNAAPETALRNYADYVAYQQSTQGHLNADGLCAVQRKFAAPR